MSMNVKAFRDRLGYYYAEEFEDIIKRYKRGPLLSYLLKIIY